ncbi:hypothetical protein P691DRAFT_702942 [Macrolepiota fuliginosa MF-IS2]|uniref:Helicase C-terminal domain-containing protein n=1 Tax=Macrolepiota fuliginosa MF-IS2 TaxID=1400762 RepID=A0A9P6C5P8_9AGAR|nr:hypothetical protein P691DRAFT_702942 [Macrolepiota fuliginosa MF-IS2]
MLRIYFVPVDLKNVKGRLHHSNRTGSSLYIGQSGLRELIPKVSRSREQWYGLPCENSAGFRSLIHAPPPQDGRTLAEIYSDLASPEVDASNPCNEAVARLLNHKDNLEGFGFRSVLYQYQRRSIAAMITHELDPHTVPDPLYIPLSTLNGKDFYFQPQTMEIAAERGMVAQTRGGLLCEELGTGKTVMVLGLILSTLNQLPSPPETVAVPPVILTALAFKYFPSGPYAAARRAILFGNPIADPSSSQVPSLVELMLHYARTKPFPDIPSSRTPKGWKKFERRVELENKFEMTSLNNLLQKNVPFYPHSPEETDDSRSYRRRIAVPPRIMYLSAATLVVVPPNLLSQWDREINKHCERLLRVLVLRSGTKMPSARVLASDYDIILMTYNRYTAEAAHKDISKLHTLPACTCPDIPGSRIPDCKCPTPQGVSPLLQVRWKRLVIDEGHVSASLSTNLMHFTKSLSVERRWIVTGTPTTNLLGLSLGKDTISEFTLHTETLQYPGEREGDLEDLSSGDTPEGGDSPAQPVIKQRIWNKYDREDMNKLDNMITHFIAVPHFIANPRLLHTHLHQPLMNKDGPRPGSIQMLNQVMQMIMIRHKVEDVEKDIALPPVIHESILLDLDPIVVKSYNALQATIAINAIDSQRTDQDYLFHPRNTDYLQITVKNMSQLMFWSVDETLYNVDQLVQNARSTVDRALQRNMPQEDIQLVEEAFRHIQIAASDPLWRRIQTHEDVPYRIYKMSRTVFNAWTRTPESSSPTNPTLIGLLHADRLLKLHDLITSRPLASKDVIIQQGAEVAETDMELRKAFEDTYKRSKNKHNRKYTHVGTKPGAAAGSDATEVHAGFMVENAAKKAAAPDTLKEMRKELDQSLAKLEKDDDDDVKGDTSAAPGPTDSVDPSTGSAPSVLLRSSVLADVVVGSSNSSKLNYIINEVMEHSADEKILIFSDSELTLAHVSEALELIQVKFLRFTTQIQPQVREQLVLTFETSETYRVFLMELKHGARGLNLISASRVIFCEPVWQADVESQAIKRAHRIGQTRSITVKTLAIRGTAEENMVERRTLFKGSHDKIPKLIEESGMRHFIANPKFLTHKPERLPTAEFPLIHFPRQPPPSSTGALRIDIPALQPPPSPSPGSASSSGQKRVFTEDPPQELDISDDKAERPPPEKKQKAVHFG